MRACTYLTNIGWIGSVHPPPKHDMTSNGSTLLRDIQTHEQPSPFTQMVQAARSRSFQY